MAKRKREQKLAAARQRVKEHEEKKKLLAQRARKQEVIDPHTRKNEAFTKIFKEYQHDVFKLSLYMARTDEAAEEVTQKTFYNFYLHFEDVKPECVRAYLLRSARNMTLNWLRDRKALREGMLDDLNDDALSIISTEDEYIRKEERELAYNFSESLLSRLYEENPVWYETLILISYLGKQNLQLAKELGVSQYVVNMRLYRAKKWLKEHFSEEYEKVKDDLY